MIPSFDVAVTAMFFSKVLQFKVVREESTYVILSKDNLTVHILRAGDDIGQMEFYLEVDEIDQLWHSIKDHLEGMKVRAPFDRDYGMREIHLEVPKTKTLMFIGQEIRKST